jgi:hypothetical protein
MPRISGGHFLHFFTPEHEYFVSGLSYFCEIYSDSAASTRNQCNVRTKFTWKENLKL